MLSEAALENPAIFGGHPTSRATQLDATRQYLRLARAHPPRTSSVIKAHLFKLLYLTLQVALRLRRYCALAPVAASATPCPCILCAAAPHALLRLSAPPAPLQPLYCLHLPRSSPGSSMRTSNFANGWARRYCSTRSSPWAKRCARRRSSSCRRLRRPCASGATPRAVSASRGTAATGRTRAQWCPSKRTKSRRPRPLSRWSRSTRAASASLARMGTRASERDEGRTKDRTKDRKIVRASPVHWLSQVVDWRPLVPRQVPSSRCRGRAHGDQLDHTRTALHLSPRPTAILTRARRSEPGLWSVRGSAFDTVPAALKL